MNRFSRLPIGLDSVCQSPVGYPVRCGKLSPAQRRALEQELPRYEVPFGADVDWNAAFGREAPIVVEIGAGSGEHVVAHAHAHPEMNHVAIEFYRPGVANLVRGAGSLGLDNIRIVRACAHESLLSMFAANSVTAAYALFPDPWPKRRHHKRRLMNKSFLALLGSRLVPGGEISIASDWPDYAEEIRSSLASLPLFSEAKSWPERLVRTRYEDKAERECRSIEEICFVHAAPDAAAVLRQG